MPPNPLLTNAEAANYLSVQPQTLAKWRMGGGEPAIPFVKVGRNVRYQLSDLDSYIAAHKFSNTVEAFNSTSSLS